jgi:hypothetical protein
VFVQLVVVTVAMVIYGPPLAGARRTRYMDAPEAAFHDRETFLLPGVAVKPVGGASGLALTCAEFGLSPPALTAETTK